MDILNNFDIATSPDFFEVNPQLEIQFKSLKEEYPDTYSELMWAIALDQHPKSVYRNIDSTARRKFIDTEYLSEPADWEKLSPYIEAFKHLALSKQQKFLIEWENKLEERQNFINALPYNDSTYELLDKMMASTDKMWKQYLTCLKDVQEEESKQTVEGGAMESPSEQGLI